MTSLTPPPANAPEWSVSELSMALKRTVEDAFGHVRVRGEISGYRGPHASGHAYFSLKDESARLDAVIWKGTMSRLRLRPQEGLDVVAIGRLTTYPGRSGYQIVIEALEFAGVGAIMAMLEERRTRLAAEGLFDPARKVPLPYLPGVVGIITSPTGAVIRDILHRLSDRFPRPVVVWPVRVQGETCAAEVAAAIAGFNALKPGDRVPRPDVIIVARGGGALEDLLGFSDEAVVRAAAHSTIPLISAVGHETDVTLIDFAADTRAPTPTAAAEMAVPVRADLLASVDRLSARLRAAPRRLLQRARTDLRALARLLPGADAILDLPRQRLDRVAVRLPRALAANAGAHRLRFQAARIRLSPLMLHARLQRGVERGAALQTRLTHAARSLLRRRADRLLAGSARLVAARAAGLRLHRTAISRRRDGLESLHLRLRRAIVGLLAERQRRLSGTAQLLAALSYHGVLARGFVLVRDQSGRMVRRAAQVEPGQSLVLEFADGLAKAHAVRSPQDPGTDTGRIPAPQESPRGRSRSQSSSGQGTLFEP